VRLCFCVLFFFFVRCLFSFNPPFFLKKKPVSIFSGASQENTISFFFYRSIYLISFSLSIVDVSGSNTLRNNNKKSQSASSVAGWIIVIRWMLQPATKETVCDLWRPFRLFL
jgi:hypothetical protein